MRQMSHLKLKSSILILQFWLTIGQSGAFCKMIAPVLEQIAEHYGEKLKVVKVDVDSNKIFAQKHGVRNIPTLMLFKNGQAQETKTGALSKTQLQEFIDQSL